MTRSLYVVFCMVLLLTGTSTSSFAARDYEKALLWDYLDNLPNKTVFYSSCMLTPGIKAVAIIPAGLTVGRFLILQPDAAVISSVGDLVIDGDHWRGVNFSGGLNEARQLDELSNILLSLPFHLLASVDFHLIKDEIPTTTCR